MHKSTEQTSQGFFLANSLQTHVHEDGPVGGGDLLGLPLGVVGGDNSTEGGTAERVHLAHDGG